MHPDKTKNDAFYKKMSFLPRAISWYGAYYFEAYPLDMSQYGRLFQSTRSVTIAIIAVYYHLTR